ncbi:hypothetical protein HN51_002887 [Arachis hypogaea]|uniref:UspA domain-containing protein n=1 Tax=Arachis hypogaea TaxID=3818 RepID=A0A445EKR5_ARAHY|nr:U-box domain-containing protein 35 [Arachis hypogaea]QHO51145.1 U-box domain-containing protein [Arachis hypogaea]RYR76060.1 hypothetical protein Ahy_A01g000652 [Arachis hypogaea]
MSSVTRSVETDYNDEEEESFAACSCSSFMSKGFKRNQVYDCSSEIGEEEEEDYYYSEELFEIKLMKEALDTITEEDDDDMSTVFSLDFHKCNEEEEEEENLVYVAVGEDDSSMEVLSWALKHAVTPSTTTLYLIHVFPIIKFIPSPLGKFPRSHVNREYVNHFLTQEKDKRKLMLKKFIDLCIHYKVKAEIMLIEGDKVAEAIVDLVGTHDVRKLVIGTNRSNLRKSRSGIADKVLKNAQETCDVKIICQGREVMDKMIIRNSNSSRSRDSTTNSQSQSQDEDEPRSSIVPLPRFVPNPIPNWLFRL